MSKGRRSLKMSHKISQKLCGQCNLMVNEEEEDFIECDKCANIYHVICTTLDKRQYNFFLQHEDKEYVCHVCDNGGNVKAELKEIKTELRKLDQLAVLNGTMSFLSKQFDDIIKGVAENKKKCKVTCC